MRTRKNIPKRIQQSVLLKSARRCALCFGLNGDYSVKKGQIAHLDRNPANSIEDNLVFLCLDHHDQYDSSMSQSKGLIETEVKTYRERLKERVAKGLFAQGDDRTDKHSRISALREALGDILPDILTIMNIAPWTNDRDKLMSEMRVLHKRLEKMCPLFLDDQTVVAALTRLGNIGGTSVAENVPDWNMLFETFREDKTTLAKELKRLNE